MSLTDRHTDRPLLVSTRVWLCLFVAGALVSGCQTARQPETTGVDRNDAIYRQATDAYAAYKQGDCARAERLVEPDAVEAWKPGELKASVQLMLGFCRERRGDVEAAREIYRGLVRDAPLSFASDDARERLRVLRLLERDPDYESWVESARARAAEQNAKRAPIERMPADFPPMAQEAQIDGYVVVEFGVTPRGDTDAPVIVDSRPPLLFDGAAIRAVREWRYAAKPGKRESERQIIRIVFRSTPRPTEAPPPVPATGATVAPEGGSTRSSGY